MPWPRRSSATRRWFSARGLSNWRRKARWCCDQPWTNRIVCASRGPHSRTCSLVPPPPMTVAISISALEHAAVGIEDGFDEVWHFQRALLLGVHGGFGLLHVLQALQHGLGVGARDDDDAVAVADHDVARHDG